MDGKTTEIKMNGSIKSRNSHPLDKDQQRISFVYLPKFKMLNKRIFNIYQQKAS